ncbi:MAG: hypothetical protein ACO1RT_02805 [Planctomycetaceae bacterium]
MITQHQVHFTSGRRTKKTLRQGSVDAALPSGRIPRVAKMMALAIRFDQLIRDGHIADQAELARLGHVTRARLTQIMMLLHLAPDIQEQILFLPETVCGRDAITEKHLRRIASISNWIEQRLQRMQLDQSDEA